MHQAGWIVTMLLAALAVTTESAWREPARYRFEYRVDLPHLAAEDGKRMRIWVPYPADTRDQSILSALIESPWPYRMHSDSLGNKLLYLEGSAPAGGPLTMRFEVERRPFSVMPARAVTGAPPDDPRLHLRSNRLIPLDGLITELAAQTGKGRTSRREKIRAFYEYVVKNMRYSKDGTGWGRGDAVWACANKRGNCTDFHSLLIGMARSQKIPARFVIGFPVPSAEAAEISGYHCWAEYYDDEDGWLPVDASEANKSGSLEAYFGKLPNDRIQFTTGRDLILDPPQDGPPLNFFIYPYVEIETKPVERVPATFRFERLPAPHVDRPGHGERDA